MKRILVALMAGAAVFTLAFASAALLDIRGETIQARVHFLIASRYRECR